MTHDRVICRVRDRFVYRRSSVSNFNPQRSVGNDFNYFRQTKKIILLSHTWPNKLYFILWCMIGRAVKKYNIFGNYTGQILDSQGNISFHNNMYNYCKRALVYNIGIFGTQAKLLYCAYNNVREQWPIIDY